MSLEYIELGPNEFHVVWFDPNGVAHRLRDAAYMTEEEAIAALLIARLGFAHGYAKCKADFREWLLGPHPTMT